MSRPHFPALRLSLSSLSLLLPSHALDILAVQNPLRLNSAAWLADSHQAKTPASTSSGVFLDFCLSVLQTFTFCVHARAPTPTDCDCDRRNETANRSTAAVVLREDGPPPHRVPHLPSCFPPHYLMTIVTCIRRCCLPARQAFRTWRAGTQKRDDRKRAFF